MNVGIAGLGLIGGSMAKAIHRYTAAHSVFGLEKSAEILETARLQGVVQAELTRENAGELDLLLLALYPDGAIQCLRELAPGLKPGALVVDLCGVKRAVFEPLLALARAHGLRYVGGHPMAGTQYSGYANSKADMFEGAPMVVVPKERDDILLLDRVKKLLTPAGFSHVTVTTAEHHDEMIAYTSQMCHVISNAYVKSPRAQMHKGYSAGSYMDLTRVAWLNEHMWTDLFLENRDFLLRELDEMIGHLQEYKTALEQGNGDRLCTLLAEGRICKEKVDAE